MKKEASKSGLRWIKHLTNAAEIQLPKIVDIDIKLEIFRVIFGPITGNSR